ncbi:Lsr2 family protein [Amycolatopsis sp. NPDC059021]|uniref:histone-like nucleoid-structuring protein Lsr2 n=1 Tax=Amycolatopsis sp. NPDC059021 TaxID=3346704 RepID=UPI00366AA107
MAEITQVVDDFDSGELADETILWAFDGEAYRSDLTAANAEQLRELLRPFLEAARSLGRHQVAGKSRSRRTVAARTKSSPAGPREAHDPRWYRAKANEPSRFRLPKKKYRDLAREWAEEQGFEVGFRIPDEVYDAYEAYRRENDLPVGPAAVGL